jgi:hypothetical protein
MGKTNKGSTFVSENVTCWNCNEKGHLSRDCPKPRGPPNQGGRGRGRGRGGGRAGGRGSGRGRGGSDPALRAPPAAGESQRKQFNGEWKYWCETCRRWTNHSSDRHVRGYGRGAGNTNANANVASTPAEPTANTANPQQPTSTERASAPPALIPAIRHTTFAQSVQSAVGRVAGRGRD